MMNAALQSYVSDQTAQMQLAGNIIQGINDLSTTDDSLGSQLTAAQGQVATITAQLQAVNLDDAAERAAVATLTQQLQQAQAQLAALTAQVGNATPTVWDALQYKTWNVAAGTVADTGASGATAGMVMTLPGINGLASRKVSPLGPYGNSYTYLPLGADFTRTRFRQEGLFLLPTAADAADSQAIEFDLQQCDDPAASGLCFNWGVQFDFAEGFLRCWNRSAVAWVPTGTLLKRPSPGAALMCQWDVHRDAANVYYDSLQINGVLQPNTAIQFPAPKLNLAAMINYGFQLDTEKVVNAYTVLVDRMKLQGWAA
jgi:hypothetical protein